MDWLAFVYLFYSFVGMYYLFLFLLIYVQNRKYLFEFPKIKKELSLSIVIPCYNEEKNIGKTISNLLKSSYPNLKKIIVVDDCSKDNSYAVAKAFEKLDRRVLVIQTPKNTGKASGAKNYGARFVKTDLIGFTDADSFPDKGAISNMIGFFNDEKVGAVTSKVFVINRENLISQLQAIEYKIIAFTRKLLGFVGGIYVTNGPLSIYRKYIFDRVGGFDENNLTEDIEITWRFVKEGYLIHMALRSRVYTFVPDNLRNWFKQRIRWNVGGLQTINKYKKTFLQCGMLGAFILPFFAFSWIIAIFGLIIFVYRITRFFIVQYLDAFYSVSAQTAILHLQDINLPFNVLVFFGVATLILSISFTIISLTCMEETQFKKHGIFRILVYMFIYLLLYPVVLITSIYKYYRGYNKW